MANLNIRVDDVLKQEADDLFGNIGMSLSTAITVFLKQAVRKNGMPFEVKADPFWSKENQIRLRHSMEQMERTGGTVHELIEVDGD